MNEFDEVEAHLYRWLEEAVELRYGAAGDPVGPLRLPAYEEGPRAYSEVLIRARARSDRVEELMSKAGRVRAKLWRAEQEALEQAQEKMDAALVQGAATRAEYSTGLERKAEATIASFAEKRAAHKARMRLAVAEEVHKAISEVHWGLNGFRTDVREIMRSFTLESSLER